ncbi:site-specific integrase [Desulfovirgula thermocuniculi]|uniref:site-specific integrase n=1 Tax=Desulfovirgula thermocuniculi TaxID=348842 RepID=UPI001FE1F01E|nr:site-specific integrase [Desulfovirgula thermocuniculi]
MRNAFKLSIRRAGVPEIRFHDLRHTHATFLLRKGVHPKVVAERLGHSSVSITLDTYSHVLPDTQAEAVRVMEELFRTRGLRPGR